MIFVFSVLRLTMWGLTALLVKLVRLVARRPLKGPLSPLEYQIASVALAALCGCGGLLVSRWVLTYAITQLPLWLALFMSLATVFVGAGVGAAFIKNGPERPEVKSYSLREMLGGILFISLVLGLIVQPFLYSARAGRRPHGKVTVNVVQTTEVGDGVSLLCDDGSEYILEFGAAPSAGWLELHANYEGRIFEAIPVAKPAWAGKEVTP